MRGHRNVPQQGSHVFVCLTQNRVKCHTCDMKTTAAAVREIIQKDPIAYEALGRDMLNTHSYARSIHEQVEEWCMKEVQVNTIVTALRRMQPDTAGLATLVPDFFMEAISVRVGLAELAMVKGEVSHKVGKWLDRQQHRPNEFFLTTRGNQETNFIFPERLLDALKKKHTLNGVLNGIVQGLAVVTLSYPSELTFEPNVGYALMRALALKHINVVEVISTYSEVSFVISKGDVDEALDSLQPFLQQ